MKKRNPSRRLLAVILSAVMMVTLLPLFGSKNTQKVDAAPAGYKTIAGLSTSAIKAPSSVNGTEAWKGSYVWFGKYNGEPVKYRVLDPRTKTFNSYGSYTMFLDCDSILYLAPFDKDGTANSSSGNVNDWAISDVRNGLNGSAFYGKSGVFTDLEKKAIATSKVSAHSLVSGSYAGQVPDWIRGNFVGYAGLNGDKVFLLDAEDACNRRYGFCSYDEGEVARVKKYNGTATKWWLRTSYSGENTFAGVVREDGGITAKSVTTTTFGVSPAMNIDLSVVLFTSVVSGTAGEYGAEYRLTIKDPNMGVKVLQNRSLTMKEDAVTVPYALSGSNASNTNRLSALILDKEYTPLNTNDAKVLKYEKMMPSVYSDTVATVGTMTFTLPTGLDVTDWGKTYYVYMVAENANGEYETDYASEPVLLPAPKTITGLCTSAIRAPETGTVDKSWRGNYVWYGKYDKYPVKYRVLAPETTAYGGSTMLMDCDYILYSTAFDTDGKANAGASKPNQWAYSDIRANLNDSAFLTNVQCFSLAEREAIASSKKAAHDLTIGTTAGKVSSWTRSTFGKYVALTGEKIFLLDSEDVSNISYGYFYDQDLVPSRLKINLPKDDLDDNLQPWWLRSAYSSYDINAGFIYTGSAIEYTDVTDSTIGVSPAFNLDRSSILYTTIVAGEPGDVNAQYKLTLRDQNIRLDLQENCTIGLAGTTERLTISVPYVVTGSNAYNVTNITLLILDKEFTPGDVNEANILYYDDMSPYRESTRIETQAAGSFVLPAGLSLGDWNKDYYVYMIAEDVNDLYETDYASAPVLIPAPGAPIITSQPSDRSATVGSKVYFSVAARGSNTLKYQWQSRKNAKTAWSNSGLPGAKTASLEVTALAGLDGWQFRCLVSSSGINTSTPSNAATLTILPQITKQPANAMVNVGSEARFTVTATGVAPLSYQWQSRKNSSSAWSSSGLPGAKTATLAFNVTTGLHGWQFRCIVTAGNGKTAISSVVTLKVVPKITLQPKNATVPVSDTVQFTVAATGKGPLKYQWQSRKNSSTAWSNSGLPGAKTATLSFPATTGLHGWQFRCVVTDANGMSWGSNAATLKVVPKITQQPKSTSVKAGSVATFTVAANGKGPLKYQWQSRRNASSSWSNSGQSGAKTATLNVNALAGLNGWQFRCVVTDANEMSWGSNPATLTVTK